MGDADRPALHIGLDDRIRWRQARRSLRFRRSRPSGRVLVGSS
jgi:hypothetical protein